MIGLVDLDLYSSQKLTLPNLEIMKLASYYQKEKKEYVRLLNLYDTNLEGYEKIFLRSDNPANQIPSHFLTAKNIIFEGLAFSKGKYLPFENDLIDFSIPSPAIYKPFLREKMIEGITIKEINSFLDNTYVRLFNGKDNLPIPPIKSKKRVYIYDDNLLNGDWIKAIEKISSRKPSSIITLHPIKCSTINQFFKVRSLSKIARTNKIFLDLPIPLEEVPILLNKYEKFLLAEITFSSEVYLNCGEKDDKINNKLSYADNIYYTLNLLYFFWSRKIPVKLHYELFSLSDTNPFHELYLVMENWSNFSTASKKDQTLLDKIKTDKQKEAFEFFLKFYPRQKNLFIQTFNGLSERRYWRI